MGAGASASSQASLFTAEQKAEIKKQVGVSTSKKWQCHIGEIYFLGLYEVVHMHLWANGPIRGPRGVLNSVARQATCRIHGPQRTPSC